MVRLNSLEDADSVLEQIQTMGLQGHSATEFIQTAKEQAARVSFVWWYWWCVTLCSSHWHHEHNDDVDLRAHQKLVSLRSWVVISQGSATSSYVKLP